MTREELLAAVKRAVLDVDPEAEVILFGSRARGDAQPDSDWDLLILLPRERSIDHKQAICSAVYAIEREYEQVLSCHVRTATEWERVRALGGGLYQSVIDEGVAL